MSLPARALLAALALAAAVAAAPAAAQQAPAAPATRTPTPPAPAAPAAQRLSPTSPPTHLVDTARAGPAPAASASAETKIEEEVKKATTQLFGPDPPQDFAQAMRDFIARLRGIAQQAKPGFPVMVMSDLGIFARRVENNAEPVADSKYILPRPAPEKRRSVEIDASFVDKADGLVIRGLHYGFDRFGEATPAEERSDLLRIVDRAKEQGRPVLVIEQTASPQAVDDALKKDAALGLVPFVKSYPGAAFDRLPPYPQRPFRENAKSVLGFKDTENFLALFDIGRFASGVQLVETLGATNFDLLILGTRHGSGYLTREEVEALKLKKLGALRPVFGYLPIAVAREGAFYWRKEWAERPPEWIQEPDADTPGGHRVRYWRADWQQIVFTTTRSFLKAILDVGFNGVLLDPGRVPAEYERQRAAVSKTAREAALAAIEAAERAAAEAARRAAAEQAAKAAAEPAAKKP
ncbi:MAG: hypothetical protein HY521_02445 [Proteobacteria bacterium]|nr:hypothetical protein [Pseudomonadota bacterium]